MSLHKPFQHALRFWNTTDLFPFSCRSKTRPSTAEPAANPASAIVPSPRSPRHPLPLHPRPPTTARLAAPLSTPSVPLGCAAVEATFAVQGRITAALPIGASLSGVRALDRRCCCRTRLRSNRWRRGLHNSVTLAMGWIQEKKGVWKSMARR